MALFLLVLITLISVFLVGSFVEYWVHRIMHIWSFSAEHAKHHGTNHSKGFWRDFFAYLIPTTPIVIGCGVLNGWVWDSSFAGILFVIGGVVFTAWSSYTHQLYHGLRHKIFWVGRHHHELHHQLETYNYGMTTDLWDRLFSSYRLEPKK